VTEGQNVLRVRLLAAAAIIGPLLLLLWLDTQHNAGRPGIWLGPVAVLASQLACQETLSLMRSRQLPVNGRTCHIGTLATVGCSLVPLCWTDYPPNCPLGKPGWTLVGACIGWGVIALSEMLVFPSPHSAMSRMAHATFVVMYCGVLPAFLVQLRLLEPAGTGMLALVGTIVVVKLSDTGAFFVGRSWGRTKLAPVLSPKKTVEGAVGGVIAAGLGSALTLYILGPTLFGVTIANVSAIKCCGYGLSLALAGMFGDLFESLLKRDANTKDSSGWLPGLGGVLDVLDSILAAAPVSFAWWISGLLRT
jgi:phosphatidate cytidylyltransferase